MKKINIFLASSIIELTEERLLIENFIRNISDKFEENYNIKIQPLLCENFDDAYTKGRKQEEYNKKIRESEFCFFIFFTKAGEYTREEFRVAKEQFEKTDKPKIYTYFKAIKEGQAEQSIYDFMEELEKTFGHYYRTFSHIDTIKLRILLSLKLYEMDFLELKVENGNCVVDGKSVMSVKNVSEFANNEVLKKLQSELESIEEEYYSLKAEYEQKAQNADFYGKYMTVASKRQTLINEINELQKLIFNVSIRMVYDDARGEISVRQKRAYELFEMGDYDGCMAVLDAEDIDNDFLKERKRIKEQEIAVCRKYIKEHKTAIDILGAMNKYTERFDEIEKRYEKIVPVIFEMGIELDTANDYVLYLMEQNRENDALCIAEQLVDLHESDEGKCRVIGRQAIILMNQGDFEKAGNSFKQAIEIWEKLENENPGKFTCDLAKTYNNAAILFKNQKNPEKAEEYYLNAIRLFEKIAKKNSTRFTPELATLYHNTGVFYDEQKNEEKSWEYLQKAISIREELAENEPEMFRHGLAMSYNSACVFYTDRREFEQAEEYILKSIDLYEKLAEENPEKYIAELATSYHSAGACYFNQRNNEKGEEYFLKSVEIYERISKKNREKFEPMLAMSYNSAGIFYGNQKNYEKAEEYFLKAIRIREKLAYSNPNEFIEDLEASYEKLKSIYLKLWEIDKVRQYNLKIIKIRERAAKKHPDMFKFGLAAAYFHYAILENDKEMMRKALEIAQAYPDHNLSKVIIDESKTFFLED